MASFLHQSLQGSHTNDTRVRSYRSATQECRSTFSQALIVNELFKTSTELKNFDDAFWCIQNTNDYLRLVRIEIASLDASDLHFEHVSSQKQFTFDYALAICTLPLDQSSYRLQTLIQYQRDKLGYIDLELLAYLERTCVTNPSPQLSHVHALYEIYKTIKLPLKSKLSYRVKLGHRSALFFSLSLAVVKWRRLCITTVAPSTIPKSKKLLFNVRSMLCPRFRSATI